MEETKMNKNTYKVIATEDDITIFQQKAGQFCNPRVYSGWKSRVIKYLVNKMFNRKEN
jgi:hypothetical protein